MQKSTTDFSRSHPTHYTLPTFPISFPYLFPPRLSPMEFFRTNRFVSNNYLILGILYRRLSMQKSTTDLSRYHPIRYTLSTFIWTATTTYHDHHPQPFSKSSLHVTTSLDQGVIVFDVLNCSFSELRSIIRFLWSGSVLSNTLTFTTSTFLSAQHRSYLFPSWFR